LLVRARESLLAYRKRIAPLVLGAGVLVVGGEIAQRAPASVEVELPIGAEHADVRQLDVAYLEGTAVVRHVSLRFPDGAPERVRHTVHLAPGRYRVQVDLHLRGGGTEIRTGRLEAPAEGVVRLHLSEGT
jgi:hypothetical protein